MNGHISESRALELGDDLFNRRNLCGLLVADVASTLSDEGSTLVVCCDYPA
jgi:hypothetical protein